MVKFNKERANELNKRYPQVIVRHRDDMDEEFIKVTDGEYFNLVMRPSGAFGWDVKGDIGPQRDVDEIFDDKRDLFRFLDKHLDPDEESYKDYLNDDHM